MNTTPTLHPYVPQLIALLAIATTITLGLLFAPATFQAITVAYALGCFTFIDLYLIGSILHYWLRPN